MSLAFGTPRPKKRHSLAPMIDVVFLLLVFFMLASQFGRDRMVPLVMPGGGQPYEGPPRLIRVEADGLLLNGMPLAAEALDTRLRPLVGSQADPVLLQPGGAASLQHVMDAAALLTAAGYTSLVVVE